MKQQKRKPQNNASKKASNTAPAAANAPAPKKRDRRDFMLNLALGIGALAVVGGGAAYLTTDVMADIHEHDLSRIGNGIPTVVQVHDPSCPTCLSLQRETRAALKNFDESELQYVIASLDTAEGRALAGQYGVGKITLLLMDGAGKRRQTLAGEARADVLVAAFERHVKRHKPIPKAEIPKS